ncbi:MAG: 3-deoxy-manno-octulosonate cytidylyltransferase [Vibrionaceae bacterium]
MTTHIIIPARFSSSRLPGKPLLDLAGKPMLAHVIEKAKVHFTKVYVATDDERILACAAQYGAQGVMTSAAHQSGTDRLAEVVEKLSLPDDDIILNLQGDEPCMPAELLLQLAELLKAQANPQMATLVHPLTQLEDLLNPNVVKVVVAQNGQALYFSRAPIPYPRDEFALPEKKMAAGNYYRHIGLYAYTVKTLKTISALPLCELEKIEKLEQLRPLAHGIDIAVGIANRLPEHGVDTADDLRSLRAKLSV